MVARGAARSEPAPLPAQSAAVAEPAAPPVAQPVLGVRFNPAVPSPAAFNHLIARITLDGKPVWMDATEEVAPFRMLAAPIRDKQALLVPDAGLAAIVQTPADPPFPNLQEWEASGSLDAGGTSNSHIKITFRGDGELFLRTVVRSVPPAQYDDLAQKLLNGLGYAGTSNHAEFSRADDTAGPLTLSMDYHREKGGDWDNLRVIPQLAPVTLPAFDDADPPIASIALSGPRTEHSTASLTLPPGWDRGAARSRPREDRLRHLRPHVPLRQGHAVLRAEAGRAAAQAPRL